MSDTAIVSEQSGETRSRGERLAFSRGEEEGQTRKQYACTDVKASAHGERGKSGLYRTLLRSRATVGIKGKNL